MQRFIKAAEVWVLAPEAGLLEFSSWPSWPLCEWES